MKALYQGKIQKPENPGLRFYLGLGLFVASVVMLPIGLVLQGFIASHFMKGLVLTVFWISAPLMKISGIGIMGKPSYLWIKYQMRYFYYHIAKAHKVGKTRYNIGLLMFIVPFIPNYILAYAPNLFAEAYLVRSLIHFFFDLVFITSLFVLGGDFWDKLRALFIFTAKVTFEEE